MNEQNETKMMKDPFALVNLEITGTTEGVAQCVAAFCNAREIFEANVYLNDNGITRCPTKITPTQFEFVENMDSCEAKKDIVAAVKKFGESAGKEFAYLKNCTKVDGWAVKRVARPMSVLIQYQIHSNAIIVYYPPNYVFDSLEEITISLATNDSGKNVPAGITHPISTDEEISNWAVKQVVHYLHEQSKEEIAEKVLKSAQVSLCSILVYPRWYYIRTTVK